MNEANETKICALEKLNDYVKGELRYLVDNELKLNSFSMCNMADNYLSEIEKEEIQGSIDQLKKGNIAFYCICQDIEIPESLFNK